MTGDPVKLYAYWTSSSLLGYAILSTNETGIWKNYTNGTYNSPLNMTGYSFWSNFTWSNSSISEADISWRIYANDSSEDKNVTDVMSFTVTNTTTTTTTSTTTTVAAGGGGGGGPSGEERPEVVGNFTVIPNFVKVIINQGDTKTRNVEVLNTGKEELEINIDTENLDKFLLLDTNKFNIKPGEKKSVRLVFAASENKLPDVYLGNIIFKGGGIERVVNVIIEVKEEKPLFDIIIDIPNLFKKIAIGDEIVANIKIVNNGYIDMVDVTIQYSIIDMDNNTIVVKEETLAVGRTKTINRRLKIPSDVKPGRYILYGKITYEGGIATASDFFEIVEKKEEPLDLQMLILAAVSIILIIIIKIVSNVKKKNKLKCYYCGIFYKNEKSLRNHIKREHPRSKKN